MSEDIEKLLVCNTLTVIMGRLRTIQMAILRGQDYIETEGCHTMRIGIQRELIDTAIWFDKEIGRQEEKGTNSTEENGKWKEGVFERIQECSFEGTDFAETKEKIREKIIELKQKIDELEKESRQEDER